ncbi:MAG: hypothetical protein ACPGVB_03155 [Chitinophagales bacterium]
MELFSNENMQGFLISFIASVLVVVFTQLINSAFLSIYKNNRKNSFKKEFADSIGKIIRAKAERITEKKILRLYRALLHKNEIKFPITIEEAKITDLLYLDLSKDLNSDLVEEYLDEFELLLSNAEKDILKINASMIENLNQNNRLPIYLALIIIIFLTLGLYFVLNKM